MNPELAAKWEAYLAASRGYTAPADPSLAPDLATVEAGWFYQRRLVAALEFCAALAEELGDSKDLPADLQK